MGQNGVGRRLNAYGGYFVDTDPGTHTVGVQAEGITGGCNEGFVGSWAGTLRIETDQDAENGRG